MSRFNQTSTGTRTVNLAGGEAFSQSPEMQLVSILLTSFANDQFYKSGNQTFEDLKALIEKCDKAFVAKAAIYARTKFGMRSITHVVASELAKHLKGISWAKDFYNAIVHRPDDMTEILSYHLATHTRESEAMKKGFAMAFNKFDKYALAKYRGENKGVKLVDVVNKVHPKPTEKNVEAIAALIQGNLKSFDTWESELTKAGQAATNDDEKAEFKKDVWVKLVKERKIGYFALLRNLRNIIEQAPEVVPQALEMLTDEKLIKKSLVMPFRFSTAYDEMQKITGPQARNAMMAITKAVDISVSNVPKFEGDTLVVLDVSSSMHGRPSQIGALFSAVLVKSNDTDFMQFDHDARYVNVNPMDSTLTLAQAMRFNGGSTNFHAIFHRANRKYDRIIILSDMQGWVGHYSPAADFAEYKKRTGANPYIYSFDLQGYGSLQFPERNIFCLAGFSDKVFDIMSLMEQDKEALINEIGKVEF